MRDPSSGTTQERGGARLRGYIHALLRYNRSLLDGGVASGDVDSAGLGLVSQAAPLYPGKLSGVVLRGQKLHLIPTKHIVFQNI